MTEKLVISHVSLNKLRLDHLVYSRLAPYNLFPAKQSTRQPQHDNTSYQTERRNLQYGVIIKALREKYENVK